MIAIVLRFRDGVAANAAEDPALRKGGLLLARPNRRGMYRALHADRPSLAQKLDLVVQAVKRARRVKRLAVMKHHHRHGRDLVLSHEGETIRPFAPASAPC